VPHTDYCLFMLLNTGHRHTMSSFVKRVLHQQRRMFL
jgi:hypothetical protein